MKHIFFPAIIFSLTCQLAFWGTLPAQEAADTDSAALLDLATEAKLQANTVADLSRVIELCQRAKNGGLTGENLKYCDQLLASAQLQRGFLLSVQLGEQLNADAQPDSDQQMFRQRTLFDLEEAVTVIKDQPMAYLRIAQLNLLDDGDEDRAKEALQLAIQTADDEPVIQVQAIRLLSEIEPDAEKRIAILSSVAKKGNPQVVLLYALTLLELDRHDEADNVLKKLIEAESGDTDLHDRIVAILTSAGEQELAMSMLDMMREKELDDARKNRINLIKADLLNDMDRYEEALELLNAMSEKVSGNVEATVLMLLIRSNSHIALGNLDDALKDVDAAEQTFPRFPRTLEQRFRILMEQEKFDDALAVAKRLQVLASSAKNLLLEIQALLALEKYDDAVDVAQRLRRMYPDDDAQWILVLIEIYSKQQAYDKALELLEEQLKEHSDELRWILAKAGVYSEQKDWDKAIDWLELQLQKEPDSRALTLTLIGVLADKKSYRTARERVRPLLEKEPKNLMLLRLDSQLSISLGLHSEAIEALTKVVEADPGDYTSVNNLAWIFATSPIDSVRDGSRAVELAEQAAKLTRHKRAFVLSTLAAAYAEAGDFEKAREWSLKSVDVAKAERGKTKEEKEELLEHLQKEWDCFSNDKPFRELLDDVAE